MRRVGVLRYDAFEDVGGRLSFSCALLDDHGTGRRADLDQRPAGDAGVREARHGGTEHLQPVPGRGGGDPAGDAHRRARRRPRDDLAQGRGRDGGRRALAPAARASERTGRWRTNGEVTIVGAGARLEGNVVSAGSLRIDGQVKGQINADGDVTLSPQSQVEADIRAQNVSGGGPLQRQHRREGQGAPRARAAASTATSPRRPSSSKRAASSTGRASWTPAPRRVPDRPVRPARRRRARPPRTRRNPSR